MIETKLFAVTIHGVDQAARYANALVAIAPEGSEILAFVVAQEFSKAAIDRADEVSVDLVQVGWADDDRTDWTFGLLES